jgi:peptidoglycan/LPS O-acetylase OafA/YrhL
MTGIEKSRIHSFDGLRGLLSLVVLAAHTWQVFLMPATGEYTLAHYLLGLSARAAVLCFFCLSGYLISASIQANYLRHNYHFDLLEYFRSRCWRVMPPLLMVFILTLIAQKILQFLGADSVSLSGAARNSFHTNILAQIVALLTCCAFGNLAGGSANGPLWSLAYEIQLYAIAGSISFTACHNNVRARLAIGVLISIYLYKIWIANCLQQSQFLNLQTICFASFGFGTVCYYLRSRLYPYRSRMLFLLTLGLIIYLNQYRQHPDILRGLDISNYWLFFQLILSVYLSTAILYLSKSIWLNLFQRTGDISYTLYICHFPLLLFFWFVIFKYFPFLLESQYLFSTTIIVMIIVSAIAAYLSKLEWLPLSGRIRSLK